LDGWHHIQNTTVLNLIPYSNDFDEWSNSSGVTVTQGVLSPSGDYDAWEVGGVDADSDLIYYVPTVVEGETYTGSMYVAGSGTVKLRFREGGGDYTVYGSDTIVLSSTWQRISATGDKASDGNSAVIDIRDMNGDTVYIWQADLTETAVPYRPIPTNGVLAYTTSETVSVALSDGLKNILSDAVGDATSEGTMIVEIKPGYDINAQNANAGFVSVRENIPSVLSHGWDGLKSHDGTTPIDGPALSSTDPIVVAVRWSKTSGKFRLGYKLTGQSWAWELEEDYDGAYTLGTNLIIGYDNPYPFAWRNLRFFRRALPTDIIEANF
jgi:hypothetical protein